MCLDRDGGLFAHILKYLLTGHIPTDLPSAELAELCEEAHYFGLFELEATLTVAAPAKPLKAGVGEPLLTQREFCQLFPGKCLSGLDLRNLNLAGMNLSGFHLTSCNLAGVKLLNADLTGARLHGADLRGANLTHAILDGADFRNAKMSNVRQGSWCA